MGDHTETSLSRASRALRRDAAADRRDRAAAARDRRAVDADTQVVDRWWPAGMPDDDADPRAVLLARTSADRDAAARDRACAARDRRAAARDLAELARALALEGHDELTGVLRRRTGLAAFARELERARRSGEAVTMAYLDVDGLKAVNDRFGHRAGDAMLRHTAEHLRSGLRPYDVIARLGGDEFAVLLPGSDRSDAQRRFDEILARLCRLDHQPQFTAGFAQWQRDEALEELIARADHEMLAARPGTRTRRVPAPAAASVSEDGTLLRGDADGRVPVGLARRALAGADEAARRRVAGDLHDLAAALLVAAHREAADGDPRAAARGALQGAVDELVRISRGIAAPDVAARGGLAHALDELCVQAAARGALLARATIDPAVDAGRNDDVLYLAARELVENTVRHARARSVTVLVRRHEPSSVELLVRDDGRGMQLAGRADGTVGSGLGLGLLRDRVRGAGGTLTLTSNAHDGTEVTIRVPDGPPVTGANVASTPGWPSPR